jgi:Domain of unknown function (DUF4157)
MAGEFNHQSADNEFERSQARGANEAARAVAASADASPAVLAHVAAHSAGGARGNGGARATAVQRMQQMYGNRAVQRVLQRTAGAEADEDIGSRIQARAGQGSNLDAGVQRRLESGLGADLSSVRVHTDHEADHLARSVDAVAFTTGSDIYFRAGTYNPGTPEGLHLLAHEATHTVQQAAGPVAGTPAAGGVAISHPGDRFEQAAEQAAVRVAHGAPAAPAAGAAGEAAGAAVQREAAPEEEEEPLQAMRPAIYAAVQREAAPEEEEPLQAMRPATYAAVQREAAPEEEEPLQAMRPATYAAVQRSAAEEEEAAK